MFAPKFLNSSNSKTAASLEALANKKNRGELFDLADYSDETDAVGDLEAGFDLAVLGMERKGHVYLLELSGDGGKPYAEGGVVFVGKPKDIRATLKSCQDQVDDEEHGDEGEFEG